MQIVPPVEFGAMHSLLYQMVFLPLCMCRNTLTWARGTFLNRFLPLDNVTSVHIFLGMFMFVQLILAFALFLFHFGTLCHWHRAGLDPVNGCEKFTMEIMNTGYAIFAMVSVIGISSSLRSRISFEMFKYVHYLFVPLYVVVIAHTLDAKGRSSMHARSQSWFWLVVPMCLYAADYIYGMVTVKRSRVLSGRLISEPKGMVLRIKYPRGLVFQPGQYVRICIPSISWHEWHPFSIASAPRNHKHLELYITVVPGGWTDKLHRRIQREHTVGEEINGGPEVLIDGPHGSTFQDATMQKNLFTVCSGSGVAPLMSLLRHILMTSKMVPNDAGTQFRSVKERPSLIQETMRSTQQAEGWISGAAAKLLPPLDPEPNEAMDKLLRMAEYSTSMQMDIMYSRAVRFSYKYSFLLLVSATDFVALGLSFSLFSNQVSTIWPYYALDIATSVFIGVFAFHIYYWYVRQAAHTKALSVIPGLGADIIVLNLTVWTLMVVLNFICLRSQLQRLETAVPGAEMLTATALLRVYRILWTIAHTPLFLQKGAGHQPTSTFLQRVSFLWCCKPEVFNWLGPELAELANDFRDTCGDNYFHGHIFVKHATEEQEQQMREIVQGTPLEESLHVHKSIPGSMIVKEICTNVVSSCALDGSVGIYFCGNKKLAKQLRQTVINERSKYARRNHPLLYGAENIY